MVGKRGSGKSSLIQLLQRFYDSLESSVSLCGIDVKNISLEYLRENIGINSQEPALFNGTIVNNFRLGWPTSNALEISREMVEDA